MLITRNQYIGKVKVAGIQRPTGLTGSFRHQVFAAISLFSDNRTLEPDMLNVAVAM